MKRSRVGDTLTGGTKDVNPNWYKILATQSGNDATTTFTAPLPITRVPQSKKATIIEVLKIRYIFDAENLMNSGTAAQTQKYITVNVSTKNFGTVGATVNDGTLVDTWQLWCASAFTNAGSYSMLAPSWIETDLSDGAGHGILLATDNIYVQVISTATNMVNTVACWLYYRFKTVPLEEYVYIVQSQQA